MKRARLSSVALGVAVVCACVMPFAEASVKLFVQECDGVERTGELAGGGLPLPDGFADEEGGLSLTTPSGEALPAQFWVMGRWPSGSIQWVHALTPVTLGASARQKLVLKAMPVSTEERPNVLVTQREREVVLENRWLRVTVPTDRFRFPGEVLIDPAGKGQFGAHCVGARNGRFVAEGEDGSQFPWGGDEPVQATVEENGPLRASVRLTRGRREVLGNGQFDLVVRLYLEAAWPAVRIETTYLSTDHYGSIESLRPTQGIKAVTRLGYAVEANLTEGPAKFGVDEGVPVTSSQRDAALLQLTPDEFAVDPAGKGKRAAGWLSAPGQHGSVLTATRDFWQQFPKGLRRDVATRKLTVDFWPKEAGTLRFFPGWAKTHEVLLGFPQHSYQRSAMLTHFHEPLRLCPTPETYLASGAVDPFTTPDWRRWPLFECVTGDSYAREVAGQTFGEIDYGDRYLKSGDRYWNGYHAPEREWLIHYQRTGEERYFRLARPMARHRMDIDVMHWPPDQAGNHHSEYNHDHWMPGGQIKSWVEGLCEYALMTGDRRAREVVAECGRWLAAHPAYTNERTSSLPVLALSHCYRVVNEPSFLETAKKMVAHLHGVAMADGHIRTPFMVGHCADALHWYWMHTGDANAEEALARLAQWMHTVCITPTGMPYYTERDDYPKQTKFWRNRVYTWAAGEVATPSARAYLVSGDRNFLDGCGYILDSWLHYYWGGGGGGYHGGPLAVYALTKAGITEADLTKMAPGLDIDEVTRRVRDYVANPPEGDISTPGLIVDLGRFLANAGEATRGLETFSKLATAHAGQLESIATQRDLVEARLAAKAGQPDRAETALLRVVERHPAADPADPLSPGHFRVAATYWELANMWSAAGEQAKAAEYRKRAEEYTGTYFVWQ